jgi:hypothetical protein
MKIQRCLKRYLCDHRFELKYVNRSHYAEKKWFECRKCGQQEEAK